MISSYSCHHYWCLSVLVFNCSAQCLGFQLFCSYLHFFCKLFTKDPPLLRPHWCTLCMVVWCTQKVCRDSSSFIWHQPCNNQTALKYTTSWLIFVIPVMQVTASPCRTCTFSRNSPSLRCPAGISAQSSSAFSVLRQLAELIYKICINCCFFADDSELYSCLPTQPESLHSWSNSGRSAFLGTAYLSFCQILFSPHQIFE